MEKEKVLHTQGKLTIYEDEYPILMAHVDGENYDVCEVLGELPEEERKANAEHIKRCWDNFYPMLEALKDVMDFSNGKVGLTRKELLILVSETIKAAEQ